MITLASVRQTIMDWIEDDSDPTLVDRTINDQLRFMCKIEFEALRRTADETPTSGGIIEAPPVCGAILGIYEQTEYGSYPAFSFMARGARQTSGEVRTNRYLYHPSEAVRVAGATGLVLSGTNGEDTLTEISGTSITADMAGKELKIAGDNTRYLIVTATAATSMTIFPTLRTTTSNALAGIVDPVGRKRYTLTTPTGEVYTEPVTIDYQIDHPPLINDDDELLIPMERSLALMVVQQFLRQGKYDVDAQRLRDDIFEAKQQEYAFEPSSKQDGATKDPMFSFRTKRGYYNGRR